MQLAKPYRKPRLLADLPTPANPLPLHLMGLVALAEAERRGEVAWEKLDLLDVGDDSLVNGLLGCYPAARNLLLLYPHVSATVLLRPALSSYLCLLSLLEESLLAGLLLGLLASEVLGGSGLGDLVLGDTSQVDLDGSGDDVSGVDAAEGDTVDLEGAGDEQNALVEGLEQDNALATESAGEKDQDSAGLEGLAGSPRALDLADLEPTVRTSATKPKFPTFTSTPPSRVTPLPNAT